MKISEVMVGALFAFGLCVDGWGCGGDQGDETTYSWPPGTEEIGEAQEAFTYPGGYGFFQGGLTEVPTGKALQSTTMVLHGGCNGPDWAASFATAKSRFNSEASGTGFTMSESPGPLPHPLITETCEDTLPNGAAFTATVTHNRTTFPAQGQTFGEYDRITLSINGNQVVAMCQAAHETTAQCRARMADIWAAAAFRAGGVRPALAHLDAVNKSEMTGFSP